MSVAESSAEVLYRPLVLSLKVTYSSINVTTPTTNAVGGEATRIEHLANQAANVILVHFSENEKKALDDQNLISEFPVLHLNKEVSVGDEQLSHSGDISGRTGNEPLHDTRGVPLWSALQALRLGKVRMVCKSRMHVFQRKMIWTLWTV